MDNIAHSLAGFALARAGLGRTTAGATLALVLASNLPDADIVFRLYGTAAYLGHHRGLSHSLLAAPFLALGLAAVLRLTVRGARFVPLVLCSLAGLAGHVFMDLWTNYGTRALLPFDDTWYAWDLTFILDPFVWALLLASVVTFRRSAMSAQIAGVGLGLLSAYVGARAVLHAQALDAARDLLITVPVRRLAALPGPLSPFRWKILADAGDTLYSGELDLNGPRPALVKRDKLPEDAAVTRIRETSDVAGIFLNFSRFPWLEVKDTPDGRSVSWRDLRFEDVPGLVSRDRAMRIRQRPGFVAQVVLGPDGRIRSESIRF
jgi:inner membrane protein